ncbi:MULTISPECIES: hypothetical protein [Acinetobacter]|uniref:hypothetical protein n=1 Tax=Acinetobacter TaxID=469 RepID=UPI0015D2E522|nr:MULTISPECIES: hypothetical protein [Acinetobacter]MCO8059160.1 hypothetical protein [Acinetobacter towneri]MCO8064900.1 hypothetical protein [Acinetobacter towneri]
MNFRDFILNKSPEDLEKYANDAGTTVGYIKSHLLYGYKEPRKKLRKALVVASKGQVSEMEILQHFGLYPDQLNNNLNGKEAAI